MFSPPVCVRVLRMSHPTRLTYMNAKRRNRNARAFFFPFLSLPFLARRTGALRLIVSCSPPSQTSSALPPAIVYFILTHERSRFPVPGFPGQLQDAASFMDQMASLFSAPVGPEGASCCRTGGGWWGGEIERQLLFHP